jgi:hypothetical protein
MFLATSIIAAILGVALAGRAALLPETGVSGTPGAYLVLVGSAAVAFAAGLLISRRLSSLGRRIILALAILIGVLTVLAAFFLMQNALLAAMTVALVALVGDGMNLNRKPAK